MTDANRLQNAAAELQKFRSSLAAADQLLSAGLYDDATSRSTTPSFTSPRPSS